MLNKIKKMPELYKIIYQRIYTKIINISYCLNTAKIEWRVNDSKKLIAVSGSDYQRFSSSGILRAADKFCPPPEHATGGGEVSYEERARDVADDAVTKEGSWLLVDDDGSRIGVIPVWLFYCEICGVASPCNKTY